MAATVIDPSDWIQLIRAEYLEMPGLALTPRQVRRLWHLDTRTCDQVLDRLVADHFLRHTEIDTYVRADSD
jgi:hypothetical protein